MLELPMEEVKRNNAKRGPRASVSAEAFGNWNKKEEFKPIGEIEEADKVIKPIKVTVAVVEDGLSKERIKPPKPKWMPKQIKALTDLAQENAAKVNNR